MGIRAVRAAERASLVHQATTVRPMKLLRSISTLLLFAGVVAGAVLVLTAWKPSINPFREAEVDRTGPAVLQSLTDLSEYHAASAYYEVVVDLEKDVRFVPGWLGGERVLYVGKGDVDAVVDFGELDERRVTLSEDGTSVTVRLPAPTVDKPVLDLEGSYVADRDEGFINKFQGSELEREAQLKAVEQMTSAATSGDTLPKLAKDNTTAMLKGLFGSLGYTDVTITFEGDVG